MFSFPEAMHRIQPLPLLRPSYLKSNPSLGGGVGEGLRKGGTVPNWKHVESGLMVSEYAKRICKEIGWPYAGNLTLLCDCISSLAYMKGIDERGGFFSLMEAVEQAKRIGVRVDRWFFQDGRYAEMEPEPIVEPIIEPTIESEPEIRSPSAAGALLERKSERKPN